MKVRFAAALAAFACVVAGTAAVGRGTDGEMASESARSNTNGVTDTTSIGGADQFSICSIVHKEFHKGSAGSCDVVQVNGTWQVRATAGDAVSDIECVAECQKK